MTKKIDGLEEAIEWADQNPQRAPDYPLGYNNRIMDAARAYAKIQSGECVVVPSKANHAIRLAGQKAIEQNKEQHELSELQEIGLIYQAMIQAGGK